MRKFLLSFLIYLFTLPAMADTIVLGDFAVNNTANKLCGLLSGGSDWTCFTLGTGLTIDGSNNLNSTGGTVTTLSVVAANGFAGTVANATTTPAITLTTSITGLLKGNGTAISPATAGSDYEVPLTFSTGLTRTVNTITVNTSQNIAKLSNLTTNGFVKTSGGDGTLGIDTNTYLTTSSAASTYVPLTRNINTSSPLSGGGGTLSSDITLACSSCVTSSSPGAGIAHFAGSTQTVTSAPVSLTAEITGILSETHGGTNQSTYAIGDTLYASASNTLSKLTGNITTTNKFYTQTGSGAASVAPGWNTITGADLPNPSSSTLGGVKSLAATTHQWINTISTAGAPSSTQPAFTDISGVCTIAQGCSGVTVLPKYRVTMSGNQSISSATWTKVQFDTKTYDTNTNYDAVTNYRFTPTVAGYYHINFGLVTTAGTVTTSAMAAIYKNGTAYTVTDKNMQNVASGAIDLQLSDVIPLNGSTDYIEIFVNVTSVGGVIVSSAYGYVSGAFIGN